MSDWHGGDWAPSAGLRPHAGGSDWLSTAHQSRRHPFSARPPTSYQASPAPWQRPPAGVPSTRTNTVETWASLSALPGTFQSVDRRPNSSIQCWPQASPPTREFSTPTKHTGFAHSPRSPVSPLSSGQGTARALSFTHDARSPSPFVGQDRLHASSSPIGGSWARQLSPSPELGLHRHGRPAVFDDRASRATFDRGRWWS